MKHLGFLLLVLVAACSEERLKLHSNIRELESAVIQRGRSIELTVEHTGKGMFISKDGEVISTSNSFVVDESFDFGKSKLQIATYNSTDTLMYDFQVLIGPSAPAQQLSYEVIETYPHPAELFTQGLILDGNIIIESSGQLGQSALSTYKLGTTDFLQHRKIPSDIFGEGLALVGDSLFQISWQDGKAYVYSWMNSEFEYVREMDYNIREGWGLVEYNGKVLWSDGTEVIRTVNPHTMKTESSVVAMSNTGILGNLNELEMYRGYLVANLWHLSKIVFINPENGVCEKELDLSAIANQHRSAGTLNGIAVKGDHLLITGKNWPVMYELEVE